MKNDGFAETAATVRVADALVPMNSAPPALVQSAGVLSQPTGATWVRVDRPRDRVHPQVVSVTEAEPQGVGGVGSMPEAEKPLIDVKEFAAKLGCCPKHIRRMADSGRCPPSIQLGALRRWNRQVVDDWIADGCPVVRHVRIGGRK
jgi:predicted DNA-binding transcriptional regulator AlpA